MDCANLRILLTHMSSALSHIHSLKLAHLDVKPDNILLILPETEDNLNKSTYSVDSECLTGVVYKLGEFFIMIIIIIVILNMFFSQ